MKVLGHIYVALEAASVRRRPLIVWGSILPEMTPYIIPNPFKWQELHEEGGDKVGGDLGMGLNAHSAGKGADRFDDFDKLELLGYIRGKDTDLERSVAGADGLAGMEVIARRVHNFLDLALDFYIAKNHLWVVDELREAYEKVSVEEVAGILSQAFGKEFSAVALVVEKLKGIIKPEELTTSLGLSHTWSRFARLLPEGETDIEKTEMAINMCKGKIEGKEEAFLQLAVEWTRQNLK